MTTKNERGLTLVEVLATFIIFTFVFILVWSIFFQGTNYSKKAVSKNQMLQEANVIITSLNSIHKRSTEYTVTSTNCSFSIQYTAKGATKTEVFKNSQMCIELDNIYTNPIEPKTTNVAIKLIIKEKEHPTNKVKIETLLSRLKEEHK
ncbi:prepilin-type N-terminal cleavage/methylation domain-containing protein [Lysinibacillus xylanilyticus]|uniref:type II secretion system protein n=1 Tax=Lysinibacillus xylanilyticus TaxID=582475 RepID=UPI002B252849|nr:prepilin-type N-terminal cleavage/methylation domain-containing protein [Lysinibacillus xylanilyticus]MEB2302764.1 prepilin-type N-terminal cleavage/methylation domain-containing protein [Lysinibacillus xylanilyticus]